MSFADRTNERVAAFAERRPLRATSVIVSLFGDVIVPRGGQVWLGSVIRLLAPLGLSERLVRTSVSRLVGDGWLQAVPLGRRSDYRLTEEGARRFTAATRRIYGGSPRDWDGQWTLVFLAEETAATRRALRAELGWLGFGALATGVYAHPSPNRRELQELLEDEGVEPLLMHASALPVRAPDALRDLVAKQWNLAELESGYQAFINDYQPLFRAVSKARSFPGDKAFLARFVLLHDYRRLLLRDPNLPAELLGRTWSGDEARALVADAYRALSPVADEWLMDQMESHDGALAAPASEYFSRFGGLPSKTPKTVKAKEHA